MSPAQLEKLVSAAACRVHGSQDASNDAHRALLAALIRGLESETAMLLCEPSLVRSSHRPPDAVVVCPVAGLHVLEAKGIVLEDLAAIEPGGQFVVNYAGSTKRKNPFAQVRNAMFDIRDAAQRCFSGDLTLPFKYWVVLPLISRRDWHKRWGEAALVPRELLFTEDLVDLGGRLTGIGKEQLRNAGLAQWPVDEIKAVYQAFGDSSVLYTPPEHRAPRKPREATLGEMFDDAAEAHKALSDEQQKLSANSWDQGPRLIRGVAGSGKTIVLANNLARRLERETKKAPGLFEKERPPKILAVCFNRSLVPLIRKKIELAYRQRTCQTLLEQNVEVFAFNSLMYHLHLKGMWRYHRVDRHAKDSHAAKYLIELLHTKKEMPALFEQHAYDAIYVDEGQDVSEDEFKLLRELCQLKDGEPSLFVFYDDAQNLYAKPRPNWNSLGLNLVGGRSYVMSECFRNTRPIVEAAFNVLYGSYAQDKANVPTKAFGDISTLVEKELLEQTDGAWKVKFAKRDGMPVKLSVVDGVAAEQELVLGRLKWLIEVQEVRPQDILVLSHSQQPARTLARLAEQAQIKGVERVHLAFDEKDLNLNQRGQLTFSTVASAKGYDAFCVLLVAANEFPVDVQGRAAFYVGCTRAIEYLEITAYGAAGMVPEIEAALNQPLGTKR